MRYLDLFGGVGGFRRGLKNHKCVGYVDNDKNAIKTYNKNFKESYKIQDVRNIRPKEIPDFDILCAGFPCQAFSIAGKRRGFKDPRGSLFFEITRILECKRPKIIFLENVKSLLNHKKGKTFKEIIKKLWELGYNCEWMVLNSKDFKTPQNRERVFIVGYHRKKAGPEILPFGKNIERFNKENQKRLELRYDGDYQSKRIYSDKGIAPTIPVGKTGGNHIPFIIEEDKEINTS